MLLRYIYDKAQKNHLNGMETSQFRASQQVCSKRQVARGGYQQGVD